MPKFKKQAYTSTHRFSKCDTSVSEKIKTDIFSKICGHCVELFFLERNPLRGVVLKEIMFACLPTDDIPLLALDDESKQAILKSQNTWQHVNIGHSTLNAPMMIRKNRLSLNQTKKEQTPSNKPEGLYTPKKARKHFLALSRKPSKEITPTSRDCSTFQT
uniref:Uncharacterized protein n=1 Tax=Glossina palpalis gambiensis TaxID=67801 RepID=A0A1B0BQN4_9MUSC